MFFVAAKKTQTAPPSIYMLNKDLYLVAVGHIAIHQNNFVYWSYVEELTESDRYDGDMPMFLNLKVAIDEALK